MGEDFNIPSKDLFDQIQGLRADIAALSIKVKETQGEVQLLRSEMHQYNGLRGKLDSQGQRIDEAERQLAVMQAQAKGRGSVAEGIRLWVPLIIGVAGFVFGIVRS